MTSMISQPVDLRSGAVMCAREIRLWGGRLVGAASARAADYATNQIAWWTGELERVLDRRQMADMPPRQRRARR